VPEDVAVAGFDDSDVSRFLVPSLTTVRQDRASIARVALELLTARIEGSDTAPRHVSVEHRLVVRESTRGTN
jgi:DNA-binding LacI/PurR family transcriptional regulator